MTEQQARIAQIQADTAHTRALTEQVKADTAYTKERIKTERKERKRAKR